MVSILIKKHSFRLGDEKYLPDFFKNFNEDVKEEQIIEENKPEPRRMQKVLNYIKNELSKKEGMEKQNDQMNQFDKEQLLKGLPIKNFNK